VLTYIYRREFGLTAQQMTEEPVDQFFLNLQIYAFMRDKERLSQKHG